MFRRIRKVFAIVLISVIILFILRKSPSLGLTFKSLEKVIVVDAGHGGSDPGTIGFNGSYEKDINQMEFKCFIIQIEKVQLEI